MGDQVAIQWPDQALNLPGGPVSEVAPAPPWKIIRRGSLLGGYQSLLFRDVAGLNHGLEHTHRARMGQVGILGRVVTGGSAQQTGEHGSLIEFELPRGLAEVA